MSGKGGRQASTTLLVYEGRTWGQLTYEYTSTGR